MLFNEHVQLCANFLFSSFCWAQNVGSNGITNQNFKDKKFCTHTHTLKIKCDFL